MKISLAKPVFTDKMKDAAINALQTEKFVLGESVSKFESMFAQYCGKTHAVSVSSGTNALQLGMIGLGLKPGKRVMTTPFTFIATSNAVIHAGCEPEFADIDEKSYNIDINQVRKKVTDKTKCLIPVHLYGNPCNMKEIMEYAQEKKLIVIEDACQAHGAVYNGKKCGSIGDVGCFSFYTTKNMTVCGDGGMVVTDDKKVADMIKKLRDCGRDTHYTHSIIGYTARLNTVNAAIGIEQLKILDQCNEKRRNNAKKYTELLKEIDEVVLPPNPTQNIIPVYHLFVIRTKKRDALMKYLSDNGIATGIHYPIPIHLQPIYREKYQYSTGIFPIAEAVSNEVLSLPMFPELKDDEIHYVCEKIVEFYN